VYQLSHTSTLPQLQDGKGPEHTHHSILISRVLRSSELSNNVRSEHRTSFHCIKSVRCQGSNLPRSPPNPTLPFLQFDDKAVQSPFGTEAKDGSYTLVLTLPVSEAPRAINFVLKAGEKWYNGPFAGNFVIEIKQPGVADIIDQVM
jgi:hypothetical protein